VFHLFHDHSDELSVILSRCDYAGVALLIAGSCFPPFEYIFYCVPPYPTFYCAIISIAAIIAFITSLLPNFHRPEYMKFRGYMFLALGLFAGMPLLHFVIRYDMFMPFLSSIPYILLMAANYICGVLIYIYKVPERWWPGKFDIYGHSHQIWHFMVLMAAISHYFGSLEMYHKRQITMCPV
jgi:adiponectin receptor